MDDIIYVSNLSGKKNNFDNFVYNYVYKILIKMFIFCSVLQKLFIIICREFYIIFK